MTPTHPQQNIFSKTLSTFLVASFLFTPLVSYASVAPVAQTIPIQPVQMIPLESLVEIPKVVVEEKIISDISRVDWEQKIMLNGKSLALNSDEALNTLLISDDVKNIVKAYRSERTTTIDQVFFMLPKDKEGKKQYLNEGLRFSIAKNLVDKGEFPKNYLDLEAQGLIESEGAIIDVSSTRTLDPAILTPVKTDSKIIHIETIEDPVEKIKKVSTFQRIENTVKGIFKQVFGWVHPDNVYADTASMSEKAVAYLLAKQNIDGSWGTSASTRFITTVAVIEAFQANRITGAATDKGIAWVSTYFTDNTDYLAQKLNVLIPAGEPSSTAETLLYDQDTTLGGFPFNSDYKVDPLTTARVIQALFTADYKDPGAEPNVTQSLALKYLLNTKRFDNGWSVFSDGLSNIPATSEVIEALLLWKHQTLGTTKIDETLDPAVSSLKGTQKSNGTWEDDLLNTALAYHTIKASGTIPTYQLETMDYLETHQENDGSFKHDIYTTAKVLKALSISTDSGKLIITDIIPVSILQTGATAEFNIVMRNTGNTAVDTGTLHIITDNYHSNSFDFRTSGIVVNAGATMNLTVGINNTRNYLGNVVFKVFIEGANNVIHPGSLYEETLSYAADPANRPALPMYFVAYKNVGGNGSPAITWRWPVKSDPNLVNVVLMSRKLGDTTWSAANITTQNASNATRQNLLQDQIYEVTLGTSGTSGNIYFFSNPVQVKVSSSPNENVAGSVSGKVKSLSGTIAGVDVLGVTASTTTTSLENGGYTQNNVPWGSGYARVSNFRYENYIKEYTTSNNSLSDIDVYTNLKPDTQDPTVTDVFIVGESDKVMENNSTKLIQYSVNDDIGLNGNGIVEGASFYYFDPHDSAWHLIGSDYGFLAGTRTFAWQIPANLLGKGFKIKVIVRDFAGKNSEETEWGDTFEIIAPPYVPSSGSENGNEFPDIPVSQSTKKSGNGIPSSGSSNENEIPNTPEPQIEIPSSGSENGNELML